MSESRNSFSLSTRTLRGMAWAYGAYGGGRVLVVVSTAILARLLTPRDFGVVALALVAMAFLEAAKDMGLSQALIVASPEEEAVRAQTVFSWSVVLGVVLALLTAAIAPLLASFFHQPQLTWLLPVLGLNFICNALGATHYALARKHLNYRLRSVSEIAEAVVRGVVGIGLALAGFGAWSLVIGYVTGAAASTVALWLLIDFRPRLRLARTHLRDLLSFGATLTVIDTTAIVLYNIDYIFIGRVLGATSLGLYTIGFRIPEMVVLSISHVAADVLFPAYSAMDRTRLREGYLKSLRYISMMTVPLAAGLAVLAGPLVLVMFGHKWTDSIPVTRVIAGYTLFAALAIPPGTVLKVTRRTKLMIAFSVPVTVVLILLLLIFTSYGIVTVALVTTALQATLAPMQTIVVSRQLAMPLRDSMRELVPPVIAAAVMCAVLVGIDHLISTPLLVVVIGIPTGAAVYICVLGAMVREELRTLWKIAFPKVTTRRSA
jgi:lipopolysaccharide exporter